MRGQSLKLPIKIIVHVVHLCVHLNGTFLLSFKKLIVATLASPHYLVQLERKKNSLERGKGLGKVAALAV
ncbi:hypothetical protein KYD79_27645, partial [Escherichia coli]|nr:hypothetical protein [Escherichia coli]